MSHTRMTHKLATLLGALAFAALFSGQAAAQAADDKDFVKDAAKGNQFEVQAGQLAEKQGKSDLVKDLGKQISEDHKKANQDLQKVASQKDIDVPKEPANKDALDDLRGLKGDEFDRKYVELMVEDHKKDIAKYRKQAEETNDPAVKKYAEDTIAVLQEHLNMSQQTQAALEKETAVGRGAGGEDKSNNK